MPSRLKSITIWSSWITLSILTSLLSTGAEGLKTCGQDFQSLSTSWCFRINKDKTFWDNARRICHNFQSVLPQFQDELTEQDKLNLLQNAKATYKDGHVWIGLKKINSYFQWVDWRPQLFQKTFSQNASGLSWEVNEPSLSEKPCVSMDINSGQLRTRGCSSTSLPFLCMRPKMATSLSEVPFCPNKWIGHFSAPTTCFLENGPTDWYRANQHCSELDSHVVHQNTFKQLVENSVQLDPTKQGMWLEHGEQQCYTSFFQTKPCESSYSYLCELYVPSDVTVTLSASMNFKKIRDVTVWIEDIEDIVSLFCQVKINGNTPTSEDGIQYEWIKNGISMKDPRERVMRPNHWRTSLEPLVSKNAFLAPGTYKCRVTIPWLKVTQESNEVTFFQKGFQTFILNIRLTFFQRLKTKDLELLSIPNNRGHFNQTFYDIFYSLIQSNGFDVQNCWWMVQSMEINDDVVKRTANETQIALQTLVTVGSDVTVDWNVLPLKNPNFAINQVQSLIVDRCPSENVRVNNKTYNWSMKPQGSLVYSDPTCYSNYPPHEKLGRFCHTNHSKEAEWEPFDYSSCLQNHQLLDTLCPLKSEPIDNFTCARQYITEPGMWNGANETCWQQKSVLQLPPQPVNKPSTDWWLDMRTNGKLVFKLVQSKSKTKLWNVSTSCPVYINSQEKYISCTRKQAFACMKSQHMNVLAEVPWCSQGWFGSDLPALRDRCYSFYPTSESNFSQATQRCDSIGGTLAIADDSVTKRVITDTIRMLQREHIIPPESPVEFWIGKVNPKLSQDLAESLQECCQVPKKLQWKEFNTSAVFGFICQKMRLESRFYRTSRVTLSKAEYKVSRINHVQLECKGRKVHPNSMISWYLNGDLINVIDGNHSIDRQQPESRIDAYINLALTNPLTEGQYRCEIGGSDSIPSIQSNDVLVLITANDTFSLHLNIDTKDLNLDEISLQIHACVTQDLGSELQEIRILPKKNTNDVYARFNTKSDSNWANFDKCLSKLRNQNPSIKSIQYRSSERCPEQKTTVNTNTLEWRSVTLGQQTLSTPPCVTADGSYFMRQCEGDYVHGAEWEALPEMCTPVHDNLSLSLQQLAQSTVMEQTVTRTSSELLHLTRTSNSINPIDLLYISETMQNMASLNTLPQQVLENTAETIDFLLSGNHLNGTTAPSKLRIIQSFDHIVQNVGFEDDQSLTLNLDSLSVHSYARSANPVIGIVSLYDYNEFNSSLVMPLHAVNQLDYNSTDTALILPPNLFKSQYSNDRVTFTIYENSQLFPPNVDDSVKRKFQVNSRVISANVPTSGIRLNPPVTMFFRFFQPVASMDHVTCAFWDFELANGLGDWSDEGCWITHFTSHRITCNCSHLTNFAVLMDVYGQNRSLSASHRAILDVITYIGCALSIIGLIMTILTFILFKKWRQKDGNKVLCNLSVALLMLLVVFLGGIDQVDNHFICIIVAVLMHYFLLASFCWMLVEAILQYLLFVRVLDTYIPRFMVKAMAFAWGTPVIIITIVLAIDPELYHQGQEYCWMSVDAMYYALMLPLAIIMTTNIGVFIRVLKGITCDRKSTLRTNQSKKRLAMVQLHAAFCIFILLGLTWIFGFLAIVHARLLFQYMFCICNSLQGTFIFVFMVVRDRNAKNLWYDFVSKNPTSKPPLILSSIRSSSSSGPKIHGNLFRH